MALLVSRIGTLPVLGDSAIVHYHRRQLHRAKRSLGVVMAASGSKAHVARGDNVVALQPHRHRMRIREGASDKPSQAQRDWLSRGLSQPGGKLPLFNRDGQRINDRTIKSCIRQGWAEPWFENPIKADWLVCKLTETGRRMLGDKG